MSRYFSCLNLNLPRGLAAVWIAMGAFGATPASASTEPAAPATTTYTTKAGDTVERVLKNAMADSPLNPQVLRKALADANPNVVNGKAGQKFKPGTALQLPEHGALVRNTLETFSAPGSDGFSRSGPSASDPASRRHWIRYP
jgi:hypothetical protein